MNGLILGLVSAVVGILAHMLCLRWTPARWRLPLLPALLFAMLFAFGFGMVALDGFLRADQAVVAAALALSLGFAYALLLNGVLHDSPTLALVNAIEAYGPDGMPLSEFDALVAAHPFVKSRLDALVSAGELGMERGELRLTGQAVHLLRLGDAYKRLRGGVASEAG